jgi:RNA polymerase sigma factor, sigma-70 family
MDSIKELYETYERYIFRYLYGLTFNHHVAEELTQETFFQILKSVHRFRGDCHVSTWIYKIARNVYCQWCRKKAVPIVTLDEDTCTIPVQYGPEESLERKEKGRLIKYALMRIPEKYREVLWLRDWQELSYEEIAAVTNHPISWVKVNIHRARLAFKKYYTEKEEI